MNSSSNFSAVLLRWIDRLRSALVPGVSTAPAFRSASPVTAAAALGGASAAMPLAAATSMPAELAPMSVAAMQAAAMPMPAAHNEAEAAESVPPLRTLEEVRADLAKLREITRARHAEAETRREMSFAPTDFMDFADHPSNATDHPSRAVEDNANSNFAPTDFLDFGNMDLQPAR